MNGTLYIYNSLSRCKQPFKPLNAPHVGMYVCGPTVYGDAHLGHARPAITFDLVFRYLKHLGYKVRYVRNITDVGHLEHDADEGEDKIAKKARLEQLEPMEIAQYYTNRYHAAMDALGVLRPSIEPQATGHIIEQQQLVQQILNNGLAYESNGSIYFDIEEYNKRSLGIHEIGTSDTWIKDSNNEWVKKLGGDDFPPYGVLSGRSQENIKDESRSLAGVGEKHNQADFALWKKASPEHIMRWTTTFKIPDGRYENGRKKYRQYKELGFPGWHCECTAMGRKYLGEQFDIHGGGMDLVFPHHECEIAQAVASQGKQMVKYWMHNNMITIGGQKMGKSLGNFITLDEFFNGSHINAKGEEMIAQPYSPMTIRFFILQAHYRSTLDFSNEALQAAEKGYNRLMEAVKAAKSLKATDGAQPLDIQKIVDACYDAMNDDFNSPIVIANLFEAVRIVNTIKDGKAQINAEELALLNKLFQNFVFDILGLVESNASDGSGALVDGLMQTIIDIRKQARANKDWATSDKIRDNLAKLHITLKDGKEGTSWVMD